MTTPRDLHIWTTNLVDVFLRSGLSFGIPNAATLILLATVTTGFSCVTTDFSALNSNWGKRTLKRPNWLDNCA